MRIYRHPTAEIVSVTHKEGLKIYIIEKITVLKNIHIGILMAQKSRSMKVAGWR